MIQEKRVVTPAIRTLLARKARRQKKLFVAVPLSLLEQVAPLGANAAFLYAILYSIHRMRGSRPFAIQPEFENAVGRGYRWWYRHTQTLERAGWIEVERCDGAKPRYRLLRVERKKVMV